MARKAGTMWRATLSVGLLLLLMAMVVLPGWGAAESRIVELSIRKGALPKEQRVIRVQQGDEVALRWTTDAPIKIHLHGYDIELALKPGVPGTIQFRARATGRFPITVHGEKGRETTLGYLEVYPR